jgi:putative transposase
MTEIIALLACLSPCLEATAQRRLACLIEAVLAMTGRVTMLGISRWTEEGGSYRTVQRFFNTGFDWLRLHWFFIRHHLLTDNDVVLIGGDETTVTKAGKKTYGVDRFFSSLYGKAVPGLSFLSLSLISVGARKSYPVLTEQVVKEAPTEEQYPSKEANQSGSKKKGAKKKGRGRPKGSRNRNRREMELSPFLRFLQQALQRLLALIGTDLSIVYLVYDGALGNNAGLQMVRQCGLHLISKLRYDAALYLPYEGPYRGKGRRRKYGDKLDYRHLPVRYLQSSTTDKGIRTDIYQMRVWHKLFADQLNVVILVKTNLHTQKTARVVLFSSDLELSWDQVIDYYSLRFQLEFNFRDAKQYWGLEDFMNIRPRPVHNAANFAMFMVNITAALRRCANFSPMSVLDLKAWFRAAKYVRETLKLLPQKPEAIFIEQVVTEVSSLGRVNVPVFAD